MHIDYAHCLFRLVMKAQLSGFSTSVQPIEQQVWDTTIQQVHGELASSRLGFHPFRTLTSWVFPCVVQHIANFPDEMNPLSFVHMDFMNIRRDDIDNWAKTFLQ